MPTPTGLPKVGEVWEYTSRLPKVGSSGRVWETTTVRFVVLERGRGDYWSLRVFVPTEPLGRQRKLWVDPSAWFAKGELKYIAPAGPKTRKKVGLA